MPTFGRSMLEHWRLDPDQTYLNHGTVGAPPARVLERQQALRDEMERQPARFMLRELNGQQPMPWRAISRLREASDQVAAFVGSNPDDLVFVPSVTTGLSAVLRSLPLAAGSTARARGATVRTVPIAFPVRDPGDVVGAIADALTDRTRLVIVDHVTASTALVLPVAAVAAACRARGVPVLVDGAHAPGAMALAISSLGVDWYAANLHKWAYAPRACGFLWAAPDRQANLHAPVVSWGHGRGFREEFEHTATGDPTASLAAPEGIALLNEWGFDAVLGYIHALAWDAAGILTGRWGTACETPREMVGSMVTVPLPERAGTVDEDAARLRLALLVEDRIEVQLHAWRGRLWIRVSAQVYNDRADVLRLADAVARRL